MKKLRRRALYIPDILQWIDIHHHETGRWPIKTSGEVLGAKFETWAQIDHALREGLRGLPGGSSLAKLLAEHRNIRNIHDLPPLCEDQILQRADEVFASTGSYPTKQSGVLPGTHRETWATIDSALRIGSRGLAGGTSLARLLLEQRGVRNRKQLPRYTEDGLLSWIDAFCQRTGKWPHAHSGPILEAPGETWLAVDMALRLGRRGLKGGSSLAQLLAQRRGARNTWSRPDFTIDGILGWIDEHYASKGSWPRMESGPIAAAPGETWCGVYRALRRGMRGLSGGSSLARLLAESRGVRNRGNLPPLSRKQIVGWIDAEFRRSGKWPTPDSGPIPEAPGETWAAIDAALEQGGRGLRGRSSLARLLAESRRRRNPQGLPPLSENGILAWADLNFRMFELWPNINSGAVFGATEERWDLIDEALRAGYRGLPGGSSLLQLLAKERGVRDRTNLPPLTEELIMGWAKLERDRSGSWPKYDSGAIADAPGETWHGVDWALRYGKRGLAPGSSLAKLLAERGASSTDVRELQGAAARS